MLARNKFCLEPNIQSILSHSKKLKIYQSHKLTLNHKHNATKKQFVLIYCAYQGRLWFTHVYKP